MKPEWVTNTRGMAHLFDGHRSMCLKASRPKATTLAALVEAGEGVGARCLACQREFRWRSTMLKKVQKWL